MSAWRCADCLSQRTENFAIMRKSMKLYHGSPEESFVPRFGLGNDEHDYGRGFYTTPVPDLAREWAVGTRNAVDGWLHAYEVDLEGLKIFDFTEVGVLAWIAELMKHRKADDSPVYVRDVAKFVARYGVDLAGYDVVRGWRADASYFFIAQLFVRNQLDVTALDAMLRLGDLGIQYFFRSEASFSRLHEIEAGKERILAAEYRGKYDERDRAAREKMNRIAYDEALNPIVRTFSSLLAEAK